MPTGFLQRGANIFWYARYLTPQTGARGAYCVIAHKFSGDHLNIKLFRAIININNEDHSTMTP